MPETEIIAPVENPDYANLLNKKYDKVLDATSRSKLATVYFAVIKEKNILLKFEPTRSALTDLYKFAPSKVKISE